jgi:hypothetical protein
MDNFKRVFKTTLKHVAFVYREAKFSLDGKGMRLPLCAKISETPSRPAFSVGGGEGNTHEDEGKWSGVSSPRFGIAWRGAE